MGEVDKISARDLISVSKVSFLLTGNSNTLRWDRSFGKYDVAVNALLSAVHEWINVDKTSGYSLPPDNKNEEDKEYRSKIKNLTTEALLDYEYTNTIPLGANAMNIIGYNLYKHYSEEIYYIRLPDRRIVVLNSENEVKKFIRKELIK